MSMYPTTRTLLETLSYYTSLWQGELSGITIPMVHCDKPRFWHTSHGIVVEALHRGHEVWLTVIPNLYAYHCDTIASRIPQTHSLEVLSSAHLYPNAMYTAESDGNGCWCTIIIQERFLHINTFIRRNASKQQCATQHSATHRPILRWSHHPRSPFGPQCRLHLGGITAYCRLPHIVPQNRT